MSTKTQENPPVSGENGRLDVQQNVRFEADVHYRAGWLAEEGRFAREEFAERERRQNWNRNERQSKP